MGSLDDLKEWGMRPEAWRELTRGDLLFRDLREAVRARKVVGLMEVVQKCERFAVDPKTRHAWEIARTLFWCAEQAARFPDFYRTEIDRVCFALADTPSFIKCEETFAWLCIRTLLDAAARRVEVPVAVWDSPKGDEEGFVATLVLEAVEGGPGHLIHHPQDVFCTAADDQFRNSMQAAWTAATRQVGKAASQVRCDGLWRLLREGQPLPEVRGGSASGAAARGWWFALQGKVPDPEVIVIAQMDAQGVLTQVDTRGVRPKVQAIASGGRFDTIVVASEENRLEAERTLREKEKLGPIRVVNLDASDA